MNKLFTKIASFVAGLAMAAAVGVSLAKVDYARADAAEVLAYTLDGTVTGGSNGYASESDIIQGSYSWKATANTTTNPWRIGGKSISSENRDIYSTTVMADKVTKVDVDFGTIQSGLTVNSVKLIVASDASFSNVRQELTGSAQANKTTTFTATSDWSNSYYKLRVTVTVSGTDNKYVQFKAAKFYKESTATLQSISLNPTSISGYVAGTRKLS